MEDSDKYEALRRALAEGASVRGRNNLPNEAVQLRDLSWETDEEFEAQRLWEALLEVPNDDLSHIEGLRVAGDLGAMRADVGGPIIFRKCLFEGIRFHEIDANYLIFDQCLFTSHVAITNSKLNGLMLLSCAVESGLSAFSSTFSDIFYVERGQYEKNLATPSEDNPYGLSLARCNLGELKVTKARIEGISLSRTHVDGRATLDCTVQDAPSDRAVDMTQVHVASDLSFDQEFTCEGVLNMEGASIDGELFLAGTVVSPHEVALKGIAARITSNVTLASTASLRGGVEFAAASIGGDLRCGAQIHGGGGVCLALPEAAISGKLVLGDSCELVGALLFPSATIAGGVSIEEADLRSGKNALSAEMPAIYGAAATIGASVVLRQANIIGGIDFNAARIDGPLTLDTCRIRRYRDVAINLENAVVIGGVSLASCSVHGSLHAPGLMGDSRFDIRNSLVSRAGGTSVNLIGSRLGNLELHGSSRFRGSLAMDAISVRGSVLLSSINTGTRMPEVSISFAHVDQVCVVEECRLAKLVLDGLVCRVLSLTNSVVVQDASSSGVSTDLSLVGFRAEFFRFTGMQQVGRVNLAGSHADRVIDDFASWEACAEYYLADFSYGSLLGTNLYLGDTNWSFDLRLEWVSRDESNLLGAYSNLAGLYKASGSRELANDAMYAGRRATAVGWQNLWSVVGYGYRPWRVGYILLVLVAALALWVHYGWIQGDIVPTADSEATACSDYPCFDAATFAADVLIPVVDLEQDAWWRVDANSNRPLAVAERVSRLLGWLLVSLLLLSFSGVVRRD